MFEQQQYSFIGVSIMKRQRGLIRNRYEALVSIRSERVRKEHRFKNVGKSEESETIKENEEYSSSLLSTTQSQPEIDSASPLKSLYESITAKLARVEEIKVQINNLSKTRLKSFKEEVTKELDKKIGALAMEATSNIMKADKEFQELRNSETSSDQERKFVNNLEKSLGWEIREMTRTLRHQEKEYFGKIKAYEEGSTNKEIELTQTQREKMKDQEEDSQIYEEIDRQRDEEINKLVASINGLTMIYKEMANLVMEQGTLIDRIDYNIDKAMDHTEKGVEQLRKAEQNQSSHCADRCIQILVGVIIVFAVIMGFKYSR